MTKNCGARLIKIIPLLTFSILLTFVQINAQTVSDDPNGCANGIREGKGSAPNPNRIARWGGYFCPPQIGKWGNTILNRLKRPSEISLFAFADIDASKPNLKSKIPSCLEVIRQKDTGLPKCIVGDTATLTEDQATVALKSDVKTLLYEIFPHYYKEYDPVTKVGRSETGGRIDVRSEIHPPEFKNSFSLEDNGNGRTIRYSNGGEYLYVLMCSSKEINNLQEQVKLKQQLDFLNVQEQLTVFVQQSASWLNKPLNSQDINNLKSQLITQLNIIEAGVSGRERDYQLGVAAGIFTPNHIVVRLGGVIKGDWIIAPPDIIPSPQRARFEKERDQLLLGLQSLRAAINEGMIDDFARLYPKKSVLNAISLHINKLGQMPERKNKEVMEDLKRRHPGQKEKQLRPARDLIVLLSPEKQIVGWEVLLSDLKNLESYFETNKTKIKNIGIKLRSEYSAAVDDSSNCLKSIERFPIPIGTIVSLKGAREVEALKNDSQRAFPEIQLSLNVLIGEGAPSEIQAGLTEVDPFYFPPWILKREDMKRQGSFSESISESFKTKVQHYISFFRTNSRRDKGRETVVRPYFYMDTSAFNDPHLERRSADKLALRTREIKDRTQFLRATGLMGFMNFTNPDRGKLTENAGLKYWDYISINSLVDSKLIPNLPNLYPGLNVRLESGDDFLASEKALISSLPDGMPHIIPTNSSTNENLYEYPQKFIAHENYRHVDLMVKFGMNRYLDRPVGHCARYTVDAMSLSLLIDSPWGAREDALNVPAKLLNLKWNIDPFIHPISTTQSLIKYNEEYKVQDPRNAFMGAYNPTADSRGRMISAPKFIDIYSQSADSDLGKLCTRVFDKIATRSRISLSDADLVMVQERVCSTSANRYRDPKFFEALGRLRTTISSQITKEEIMRDAYVQWLLSDVKGKRYPRESETSETYLTGRDHPSEGEIIGPMLECLAPYGSIMFYEGGTYGHIEIKTEDSGKCGFVSDFYNVLPISHWMIQSRLLKNVVIVNAGVDEL